jgi:hypothetical protein
MKNMICCFLILLMALVCAPAKAQGPLVLYDDFKSDFMDIEKWTTSERRDLGVMILESVRELHGGRLHMMGRAFGNTVPADSSPYYSGVRLGEVNSLFGSGEVFRSLNVSVKVNDTQATGCPDSYTSPTSAQARLLAFYFNAGEITPLPTPPTDPGRINDVLAGISIQKLSNSTDKPQLLEVWAYVLRCTNPGCGSASSDGPPSALLGKIMFGQWATIQIDWDGARVFNLRLNKEPTVVHKIPDSWKIKALPPSRIANILGVSNRIANCPPDERAMGFVDAEFDNLFVGSF